MQPAVIRPDSTQANFLGQVYLLVYIKKFDRTSFCGKKNCQLRKFVRVHDLLRNIYHVFKGWLCFLSPFTHVSFTVSHAHEHISLSQSRCSLLLLVFSMTYHAVLGNKRIVL